ncbi:hypothetical protein ZWY2020_023639 [Hordeum vulgare]|nr:hypothetical protein ZWY2020_023639 [Hordeum vulgare]
MEEDLPRPSIHPSTGQHTCEGYLRAGEEYGRDAAAVGRVGPDPKNANRAALGHRRRTPHLSSKWGAFSIKVVGIRLYGLADDIFGDSLASLDRKQSILGGETKHSARRRIAGAQHGSGVVRRR